MCKTWKEALPHLNKQITKGQLFSYDGCGFTRGLTENHKEKIEEIKEKHPEVKVIGIIDASYTFGNGTRVSDVQHHIDYLLMDEEGPFVLENGSVEILSYTVNETYGEEEMGAIVVAERLGMLKRIS